jgi:hypothetical protein
MPRGHDTDLNVRFVLIRPGRKLLMARMRNGKKGDRQVDIEIDLEHLDRLFDIFELTSHLELFISLSTMLSHVRIVPLARNAVRSAEAARGESPAHTTSMRRRSLLIAFQLQLSLLLNSSLGFKHPVRSRPDHSLLPEGSTESSLPVPT